MRELPDSPDFCAVDTVLLVLLFFTLTRDDRSAFVLVGFFREFDFAEGI